MFRTLNINVGLSSLITSLKEKAVVSFFLLLITCIYVVSIKKTLFLKTELLFSTRYTHRACEYIIFLHSRKASISSTSTTTKKYYFTSSLLLFLNMTDYRLKELIYQALLFDWLMKTCHERWLLVGWILNHFIGQSKSNFNPVQCFSSNTLDIYCLYSALRLFRHTTHFESHASSCPYKINHIKGVLHKTLTLPYMTYRLS